MKTYSNLNILNGLQPMMDEICINWINENKDDPYIEEQFCDYPHHSTMEEWEIVNWITVTGFCFLPGQASSLSFFRLWSKEGENKLYKEELIFLPNVLAHSLMKACVNLA